MAAGISRIAGLCALFLVVAAVPSSGAPQPPTVKFTASGDFSSSASAQAVLSSIGSLDPDLHLALGDLSYGTTGNEQAWCDLVTAGVGAGFPFELIAGNHESNGQNGNINDFSACLPNQLPGLVGTYGRQAYVDVPRVDPLVRYVMISPNMPFPDSTWEYTAGSPRYNWTAAAIDGARTAGIPWVVAAMHKPCLAVGDKSCEPGPDLTNMLISKKVDLVLTGHDHSYGRTKQLGRSPGCPAITPNTFNAACVADDDSTMAKGAGTVFATIGTGGVSLRDVNAADPEAPYFAATSGLNSNPTFGSLEVTADADELSARFVRAAGGTFTDAFTIGPGVPPVNQPPVASFTESCTQLSCSFDATGSSDPDGTISNYAWNFGDSTTGTGATPSHQYAASGTYPARLTVTDDDGAQTSVTRNVTVSGAPANQPPVASFTVSCTDLSCSFNGSGSSDPDGSIASYAWDFGDGTNGTGVSPSHTYTTAGSYTVQLTVTDNEQATNTTTRTANPTAPPSPTFATDTFSRTVTNGLGAANSGGNWSLSGSATNFSVSGGLGRIRIATAGSGSGATLGSVSQLNTDLTMSVATDQPATGGGVYISVRGRQVPGAGDYRTKLRLNSNGTVGLSLSRASATGAETSIQTEALVSGLNYAVGDRLNVRLQVTGTSPTTIRARVWKVGTTEPTTWQRSVTDNTAGLQANGSIGITLYLSSSATNAPIEVSMDDLVAKTP